MTKTVTPPSWAFLYEVVMEEAVYRNANSCKAFILRYLTRCHSEFRACPTGHMGVCSRGWWRWRRMLSPIARAIPEGENAGAIDFPRSVRSPCLSRLRYHPRHRTHRFAIPEILSIFVQSVPQIPVASGSIGYIVGAHDS